MKEIKFKLLNHTDSVYKDWLITITINSDSWNEWEDFCIKTRINSSNGIESQTDIETRFDVDEARECGVIGIEHLDNYLKWITTKK